jgi:serine/threonine protein kinase
VKVIDLGSSCYVTDHLSSYVQSRSYRAPEVIVGAPYGVKIDVWSLGCVLAELYTGEVLFQNDGVASMLARCVGVLGPFDPALLRRGRHAAKFFTKSGLIYERDERSGELRVFEPKRTTLRARLGFATKREGGFVDFLLALLRPNPDARLRCVPYTGPRTTALAW